MLICLGGEINNTPRENLVCPPLVYWKQFGYKTNFVTVNL